MQTATEVLEFPRILEQIASFARTEIGKRKALSLCQLEIDPLKEELLRLREAGNLYDQYGRLPIDAGSDLETPLTLARKGYVLSVEDLERVCSDVLNSIAVKKVIHSIDGIDALKEYVLRFEEMGFLEKDIHKVIAPDLTIYDNASPALKHIRASIARLEKEMVAKLGFVVEQNKDYLSSAGLTIKNGHYVLPVANAYKGKVKGIVQDVSGSGGTTFIEPELLVSMNNKMVELKNDEKEEIQRLLSELSHEVGGSSEPLLAINKGLGYLDFLQAKILYGESLHCHIPDFSDDASLFIPALRHPLLEQKTVVPNDFILSPSHKVIIISGPNAGGKTVALKTIATAVLLFEMAVPVPCKQGALIPYFKHVYLDIGDSQSISDNLSTFSGHMRNLASICEVVGGKDLVLLDEVGTGTSPKEGEAIAYAVIRFLLEKHCYALISSHFEGLKAYAMSEEAVENASMLFNTETLSPTYVLKMGLPGESYGLTVARRYGVDEKLLSTAKDYLDEREDFSVSKAIDRLARLSKETEDLKARLQKEEAENAKKQSELQAKESFLKKKEEEALSSVASEKKRILEEAEKKVEDILEEIRHPGAKMHEAIAAKKKLEGLSEQETEVAYSDAVTLGDYVTIPSFGVTGKIIRINGSVLEIATPDGVTMKTAKGKVIKSSKPIEKKVSMKGSLLDSVGTSDGVGLELKVIGMRADEAQRAIDSYLDKCRLKGFKRVRIIHGMGSGVLRRVTAEYCKAHKDFIASFELGGEYEGGGGATVVHLK